MCWVLYYAIPGVILIFKELYLWYMALYLYFIHKEIEVERPSSSLFRVTYLVDVRDTGPFDSPFYFMFVLSCI